MVAKTKQAKAAAAAGAAEGVKKDMKELSGEEKAQKVRKTVGWLNHNGGLTKPLHYQDSGIADVDCRTALKILNELAEKGGEVRNPTAWVQSACAKVPDRKVRTTIHWYNTHGNLKEEIKYDEVKEALAAIGTPAACKILADFEDKTETVNSPTQWILAAAKRAGNAGAGAGWAMVPMDGWWGGMGGSAWGGAWGGDDKAIRKVIGWFNKQGNLQEPLKYDECGPLLSQLDTKVALALLNDLEGKEAEINNPTAWICRAARKRSAGDRRK